MKTSFIQEQWEDLCAFVFQKPPSQIPIETKKTFYSGAQALLYILAQHLPKPSDHSVNPLTWRDAFGRLGETLNDECGELLCPEAKTRLEELLQKTDVTVKK